MADAVMKRPDGPEKFALILGDQARELASFERYERRALSRRRRAVRAFDAARAARDVSSLVDRTEAIIAECEMAGAGFGRALLRTKGGARRGVKVSRKARGRGKGAAPPSPDRNRLKPISAAAKTGREKLTSPRGHLRQFGETNPPRRTLRRHPPTQNRAARPPTGRAGATRSHIARPPPPASRTSLE
jgi:hypothetical protein